MGGQIPGQGQEIWVLGIVGWGGRKKLGSGRREAVALRHKGRLQTTGGLIFSTTPQRTNACVCVFGGHSGGRALVCGPRISNLSRGVMGGDPHPFYD